MVAAIEFPINESVGGDTSKIPTCSSMYLSKGQQVQCPKENDRRQCKLPDGNCENTFFLLSRPIGAS